MHKGGDGREGEEGQVMSACVFWLNLFQGLTLWVFPWLRHDNVIWIFWRSDRVLVYLAVKWRPCQDAPLHLSNDAATADESITELWCCWKGYWGINYTFMPLYRGHTAHRIKYVTSYMLHHVLTHASDTTIANIHIKTLFPFSYISPDLHIECFFLLATKDPQAAKEEYLWCTSPIRLI